MNRLSSKLQRATHILVFILAAFLPLQALAAAQDRHSVLFGTEFYDTETDACVVQLSSTLSGNDNFEKVFRFFVGQGLSPVQAAGFEGNLIYESGGLLDPTEIQGGGHADSITVDGVTGYGIAQWTDRTRQQGLVDYAKSVNGKTSDLGVQLNYLWKVDAPKQGDFIKNLKNATTLESATLITQNEFERPQSLTASIVARTQYAKELYKKFGQLVGVSTVPPDSSGGCSNVTQAGEATKYIGNFVLYSQYDPAWKDKPYGSSTIAVSGCGPTSMAMIISTLTGNHVTPVQTADYAASQGLYISGVGSSWQIGPALASHWGLKSEQLRVNVAQITDALQGGALVIVSGQGPLPFTSGGHFIVIRGVTPDNKWKVGDPAHDSANNQDWDPSQIITNTTSAYAIRK